MKNMKTFTILKFPVFRTKFSLNLIPLVSEKIIILLQIFNRFFSLSSINISELGQFDQMLVHMFVFIYQYCCLIVVFMYFCYIGLFPSPRLFES